LKEQELREVSTCGFCKKKFGASGAPFFYRVKVERYMLDGKACQRQQGLGMMIGGGLAQVMGTNEDLANRISSIEITVCQDCALERDVCVAALKEEVEESQAQNTTHDTGEPQEIICPPCNGHGEVTGPGAGGMELIVCDRCNGTGKLPVS